MGERVDELATMMRNMELNILSRLSEQDVKTARIEEGQRAIHKRIDDHMEKEEMQQLSNQRERTIQMDEIHLKIKNIDDRLTLLTGAEVLNTGWRTWLTRIYRSGIHFLQWVGAGLVLTAIWVLLQNIGLVN